QEKLAKANMPTHLLVDCSHGNCNKDYTRMHLAFRSVVDQRVVDGNMGIIGAMLESNIHPGNQKLNGGPAGLKYGVSITDSCIGWEETEVLLRQICERL
ncbi:MAG: 3-deoxy-7-phosphoheptulonate synthase, partial [Candidatus Wildermuthbacteria bacterium]|nr:3-deoxy-7-phosphoheptulonate synthase [Candidatus Wildermuthbacteria bacterium]